LPPFLRGLLASSELLRVLAGKARVVQGRHVYRSWRPRFVETLVRRVKSRKRAASATDVVRLEIAPLVATAAGWPLPRCECVEGWKRKERSWPTQSLLQKPAWLLGAYIAPAGVVAVAVLGYFVPQQNRASSAADQTAAAANYSPI
jgi:hypothetical protein